MKNKLDCLKLINFIEKSNLFITNQIQSKKILIAFSGGQDSSSLLTIFYILSQKWGFELGAVYCNHCWNHSTQTSFAIFKNLKRFEIPFYFIEAPNSQAVKPEQKARDWRYSCFQSILKSENYDFLLTGHSLSDCSETVLFNLVRGSGLKGLCSLKESQVFSDFDNPFAFKKTRFFIDSCPRGFTKAIRSPPQKNFYKKTPSIIKPDPPQLFLTLGGATEVPEPSFGSKTLYPQRPQAKTFVIDYFISKFIKICFGLVLRCSGKYESFTGFKKKYKSEPGNLFSQRCLSSKVWTKDQTTSTDLLLRKSSGRFVRTTYAKGPHTMAGSVGSFLNHNPVFGPEGHLNKAMVLPSVFLIQNSEGISKTFSYKQLIYVNQERFLFNSYRRLLKNFQKLDQTNSLITCFEMHSMESTLRRKKNFFLNGNIQKLIRKKKKEKTDGNQNLLTPVLLPQRRGFYDKRLTNLKEGQWVVKRPLIRITRESLYDFSNQLKIPINYDKSNKDLNITRNYIRKLIIPLLKKLNPRVEENLFKFSRILEFYYEYIGDLKCPANRFDIFKP
uniref:tRNA(Ile)-lysidine synthase, chloroplastic n=1 Tax=Sarcinofilum mucosum TaxID=141643 RepID=A0A1W6EGC7_SARMC|nr:tRNA(Ile)-lysidine synthetase [Sarcinofilum mucosum]ARK14448.1 tRNA(Ile)-lysidine synthetase [Sarcinofilum mucosum]